MLFGLILLRMLGPTHPRRMGHHHETLQSSKTEQTPKSRFSALYTGQDWAEVTHLPPGWEILDFGAPGDHMRFQKSHQDAKVPSDNFLDLVHCVQGSDGKIHCGLSPPSTNPNHGDERANRVDVTDLKPEHLRAPGGVKTKEVDSGKSGAVDGNPTSSDVGLPTDQNTKPSDKEQNPPSSENTQGTSAQSSPTGDKTGENSKSTMDTKPGSDGEKEDKGYVIGGGFVVTLEVCKCVPDSYDCFQYEPFLIYWHSQIMAPD